MLFIQCMRIQRVELNSLMELANHFCPKEGSNRGMFLDLCCLIFFINNIVGKLECSDADPILVGDVSQLFAICRRSCTFTSSPCVLQTCLDTLYVFCSCWKLEVNNSQSKVLIYNSNGKSFLDHFMYNGNVIETVNSYCYLGIMLKCNGSFNLAMPTLAEKAIGKHILK